jgi:hypothetical protein
MTAAIKGDWLDEGPVELSEEFREAVRRWENAPHNQPGADKTWVERLIADWSRHYRLARQIRR